MGPVDLAGGTLNLVLGFSPAPRDTFTILNNDATDAVVGTFNGLPQGAVAMLGGKYFSISYTGGTTGNDVALTRVSAPFTLDSIANLGNGYIQFSGHGESGLTYSVEANPNLTSTNWSVIGATLAGGTGLFAFTDTNASLFPTRFYRSRFL